MRFTQRKLIPLLAAIVTGGALLVAAPAEAATLPTNVHARAGNHQIALIWSKVPKATSYRVSYTTGKNFTTHKSVVTRSTHAMIRSLVNGHTYRLRVIARHGSTRLGISRAVTAKPHAAPTPVSTPKPTPPKPTPTPTPTATTQPLADALARGNSILQAGTYTFNDFTQNGNTAGYLLPASLGALAGQGADRTVVQMTPNTSTKKGSVPAGSQSGTTNQLSLLVAQGSTALHDFTLQGTSQGHLYNGLRINRGTNNHITNVKVKTIPGDKNYPPGETFGINDYRTNGSIYKNIEVDGAGVGAAGFGGNNSENIQISNAYFHGNPYSAGITFWQSRNITLTDVRSENNHGAFNFERDAGNINIIRPQWSQIGNRHAFSFNSDIEGAKVNIYDPVLPAGTSKIYILVAKNYLGVPNKQKTSDIRVFQNGKDVTSTLVTFAQ